MTKNTLPCILLSLLSSSYTESQKAVFLGGEKKTTIPYLIPNFYSNVCVYVHIYIHTHTYLMKQQAVNLK